MAIGLTPSAGAGERGGGEGEGGGVGVVVAGAGEAPLAQLDHRVDAVRVEVVRELAHGASGSRPVGVDASGGERGGADRR